MTTTQPKPSSIAAKYTPPSGKFFSRMGTFIKSHVVETITASVALSLVLVGASTWNAWNVYRSFTTTVTKQYKLQDLSGQIVHLDEVLTMSARMAASTGDGKWEERYRHFEPVLIKAIEDVIQTAPNLYQKDAAQTDAANIKLVELENRAFELVRQGKSKAALALLLGQEYEFQKQIYTQGMQNTLTNIKTEVDTQLQDYSQRLLWSVIFAGISFFILLLSWLSVLLVVRAYIRERNQAQESLIDSQAALLKFNEQLEQRTQQLYAQEQATKQDNEILQSDVGQLLDVVSALEAGDLTIQAEVSDRATGLVADTLNRLSEELARIISTALSTAQQVAQGAKDLEQLAVTTALQTQQQAQSVVEVQTLIKDVNNVSQDTAQQSVAVDQAVQRAEAAVAQGLQEMTAMTTGIEALHQGSDQIVKRAQALTDFVELAAQFAKNQKRVASMTRVLALNASLLSARASGQQDPEQFASVAREFETVATQVNDLAVQTNQSLILLQQRTDQIQTVVSGLNQDVQDINQLVNDFTMGVGQSRQVFDNIKTATEQVAQVEQQVTQSSQAIALAAQTTLKSIQDIATVAAQTERQASFTREQSGAMGQLAHNLLEIVKFFQLSSH